MRKIFCRILQHSCRIRATLIKTVSELAFFMGCSLRWLIELTLKCLPTRTFNQDCLRHRITKTDRRQLIISPVANKTTYSWTIIINTSRIQINKSDSNINTLQPQIIFSHREILIFREAQIIIILAIETHTFLHLQLINRIILDQIYRHFLPKVRTRIMFRRIINIKMHSIAS